MVSQKNKITFLALFLRITGAKAMTMTLIGVNDPNSKMDNNQLPINEDDSMIFEKQFLNLILEDFSFSPDVVVNIS